MSSKRRRLTLPDGEVVYVDFKDINWIDLNPRVELDRCRTDDENYDGLWKVKKEEIDELDYGYNNVAENMILETGDEPIDIKMEIKDEEIEPLEEDVSDKISTADINLGPPATLESREMESITDEEFKGFGHISPSMLKPNNELTAIHLNRNPFWERNVSTKSTRSGKSGPRFLFPKNTQSSNSSSDTAPDTTSPEPHRKPFREIEASFGTNPLILPEEDESTEADTPQIFPSTSTSALAANELMTAEDNDLFVISSTQSLSTTQLTDPMLQVEQTIPQPPVSGSKLIRFEEPCCLIDKLSKRKFTSDVWWSEEERERIIRDGKPTINYEQMCKVKMGMNWSNNFESYKWLTGCVHRRKFYCWTCLLFADKGVWVFNGKQKLAELDCAFIKHKFSKSHQLAEICAHPWTQRNSDDTYKSKHNQTTDESLFISTIPSKQITLKSANTKCSKNDTETSNDASKSKPNNDHQKPCVIRMLLNNNFVRGTWKEGEQDTIVTQGRRCPSMEYVLGSAVSGNSENIFNDNLYVKYPWLTGSWEKKKLYCWPCLLYDVENCCLEMCESAPAIAFESHEILNSHLESSLCLKLLEHDIKNRSMSGKVEQDHDALKTRLEFLKHLIDVVCITKTTLKNSGPLEEDCAELLKLIASYNMSLDGFMNEMSNATGKDAARYLVENHGECVLTAITHVMMEKIKIEVLNSPFISIMLDDVKGLINKSFISVIIRYAEKNGEVRERFIKFIEVGYDRSSHYMINQVMSVVNELGCKSKLVAFCYDGAVIDPAHIKTFNSTMNRNYLAAQFFHNRNHNLKFLIQQALSHLKECRHFFLHLVPLMNFFNRTPAAIKALIELECKTLDVNNMRNWDFSFDFARTIHHHYPVMITLFENITKSPDDWDIEHVVQAPYYLGFLRKYQNRFFIVFLSEVFSAVDGLAEALQHDFDVNVWLKAFSGAMMKLRQLGDKLYRISQAACSDSLMEGDPTTFIEQVGTLRDSNKELYAKLLTYVKDFISAGAQSIENFKFFDSDIIRELVDKSHRAHEIATRLTTGKLPSVLFNPMFNVSKLRAQLKFHFTHKCFKPITTINDLVNYMDEYGMSTTMDELHRLLRLMLTIPMASTFVSKTTTYERMGSYAKNNIHNLSSVNAFMWMEKDLLESLQEDEHFYESVISHFAEKSGKEQFRLERGAKI